MKDINGKLLQAGDTVLIACVDAHVKPFLVQAKVDEIRINKADGTPRKEPMAMFTGVGANTPTGIHASNVLRRVAVVAEGAPSSRDYV